MIGLHKDENLFMVDRIEDIPLESLLGAMEEHTFACLRGLVSEDSIKRSLNLIDERFDYHDDHATVGQSPDAVRTNFQRLVIGGESTTSNNDDARLFRTFYNPIWAEDVFEMRDSFVRLAQARNRIAGQPLDFGVYNTEPNGLWTAARVHQYPSGGGFFRRHTDYIARDIAEQKSTNFFQLVLTMTRKNEHFQQGGSFVEVNNTRINLDDVSLPGDILVYDGRTVHGVEDIDPHKTLDLTSINGRLAGFATLFKKM